ncbi:CDP-diacylglycerol--glycerol-3-phosphate 3-phosphatidyltransferase [Klebsiella pneumoniae]|uniref:CDP-diacylglycerol--glycerol-3-phosphate 3-phosphatidyltransferase n=1 Tax=Klebsiella pneumoniae TaxID=573 RepID=A0A378FZB4_KLEPN|nr:CDP-diacylglycerol--glycerol-3-phosphate 3-phosphatidyltransferase [Klebsiella pneumoniae]
MIAREIIISALREWMAELGKRSSVAVSWIGKVKTTAQMTALVWMLWRPYPWVEWAGIALFLVAGGADAVVDAAVFERGARRFA